MEVCQSVFRVAAYTNIGLRKKTNQDSCCAEVVLTPFGDVALLAVCDGVGGLSSGEIASSSVIEWLLRWFERDFPYLFTQLHSNVDGLFGRVQSDWEDGLIGLNAALRDYGRSTGGSLGTTFTAILMHDGNYFIGHVGDTRVYRFTGGKTEQLTQDQTWVARELARGNITPEQARSHHKKNVILQSIGTQSDLQPVYTQGTYRTGDTMLVCCDGFRNELFDDELDGAFGSLSGASVDELYHVCETCANMIMNRGELDNISAVVLTTQAGMGYEIPDQAQFAWSGTGSLSSQQITFVNPIEAAEATTDFSDDDQSVATDAGNDSNATTLLDEAAPLTTVLTSDDKRAEAGESHV